MIGPIHFLSQIWVPPRKIEEKAHVQTIKFQELFSFHTPGIYWWHVVSPKWCSCMVIWCSTRAPHLGSFRASRFKMIICMGRWRQRLLLTVPLRPRGAWLFMASFRWMLCSLLSFSEAYCCFLLERVTSDQWFSRKAQKSYGVSINLSNSCITPSYFLAELN